MATSISIEDTPNPDDLKTVRDGLSHFNLQYTHDDSYTPISIFLRDANGTVTGGLLN